MFLSASCPRYCALPSPRKRAIFEFVTGVTGVTGAQICRRLIIYTKQISAGTCMFPTGYACIRHAYTPDIYIYIYIYMLIAGFLLQLHFLCAGWAQPDVSTVRAGVGTCSALMPRGQWVRYSTCVTRPHGPEVYARSRVPNRDHQHTTPTGKTLNIHIFKSTHIYIYIYMLMSCRSYK